MVADEKEERDEGRKIAVKPKSADKYVGLPNKCSFSNFLHTAGLGAERMSGGSEFHAAGPECEKA